MASPVTASRATTIFSVSPIIHLGGCFLNVGDHKVAFVQYSLGQILTADRAGAPQSVRFASARWFRASALGYVAVGILTVAFAGFFAQLLLSAPAYYPAIDQRHFLALAHVAHEFLIGAPHSWLPFRATLPSQYNALFALPLVPAFSLFGESYYVYGMSVSLIYASAAALAVAAVSAVVLAGQSRGIMFAAFAATALFTITRSAVWFSTRSYYPDVGDAFVLALWLMFAVALLRRPDWQRTLALIIVTLAVILFRRHLLFAWGASGIGLAISVVISRVAERQFGSRSRGSRRMRVCAPRLGLLAASAIATLGLLYLIAPSFLQEMVLIANADAYRDYERDPHDVLVALLSVVGLVPLVLSAAGYVASGLVFRDQRYEIVGVGLGGILHVLLWTIALRQIGPQYYVVPGALFLPIGIGLGVAVLANLVRTWQRTAALTTATVLLCLSAGRMVQAAADHVEDPLVPHLWQDRVAPLALHRGMKEPFMQVFSRIGHPAKTTTVFVVASSRLLNEAIIQSAAEALLGKQAAATYFFPWVPAVDARDRLPLTELLQADFVLIPLPPQSDLPTGFNGLGRVLDMFVKHDQASLDFKQLGKPIAFPAFSVAVYQRVRMSDDATAIASLEELKAAVGPRGFNQPSWVEIGRPSMSGTVEVWANDAVVAHDRDQQRGWPADFLSYDALSGPTRLAGDAETTCPQGAILTMYAVEQDRTLRPLATSRLDNRPKPRPFLLEMPAPAIASHLELEINAPNGATPCDVTLRHLQLTPGHSAPAAGGA